MRSRLARIGIFLAVLVGMWGLLLLVGRTGAVGEIEVLIWLLLLVVAEIAAMRWSRQLSPAHRKIDQPSG